MWWDIHCHCRNGKWRSQWSVTFPSSGGSVEVSGVLKVQVHYYEDGNVQLVSSKQITDSISFQVIAAAVSSSHTVFISVIDLNKSTNF